MSIFYPDSYAPYHADVPPVAPKPGRSLIGKIVSALGLRSHLLPNIPPGRLLEVGCASGYFLQSMRHVGWDVEGIEYSASAAAVARRNGFSVQISSIEEAAPPPGKVDLIAGWMVAEHLHEPRAAFDRLRTWVAEDGWMVLSVPDASALEARFFGDAWYALQIPTHLFHYTPRTVTNLLRLTGWKVVRIRHQPNALNLLNSIVTALEDRHVAGLASFFRAFAEKPRFAIARRALGIVLGGLRQSGRMEIWARPMQSAHVTSQTATHPATGG